MATAQLMKAAARKLRMAAGPATSMAAREPRRRPVPMEPPTATMAICPAESWWRRPSSLVCIWWMGGAEAMEHHIKKGGERPNAGAFVGRVAVTDCFFQRIASEGALLHCWWRTALGLARAEVYLGVVLTKNANRLRRRTWRHKDQIS